MSKEAVRAIINAIGEDAICKRLGVKPRAIRHARSVGRFAASWYAPLKEMADPLGVEVPIEIFNWRSEGEDAA